MQNITCTRWSLGLYVSSQACQALLLQWCFGRPNVHGFWRMPLESAYSDLPIPDAFFDPIFRSLQDVGASHQLEINIGLEHQHFNWQPLPTGGPVIWQRQAGYYWQLPPAEVYLDALPIAPATGLLVSIPQKRLDPLLQKIHSLRAVNDQPIRIGLEADVSSLFKLWPWRLRRTVAMANWQARDKDVNQCFFVDQGGLHLCQSTDLPSLIEHYLYCHSPLPLHQLSAQGWRWEIDNLPAEMLIPWHLAYLPSPLSRPGVAWHSLSPLSFKQRLSLLAGFSHYHGQPLLS